MTEGPHQPWRLPHFLRPRPPQAIKPVEITPAPVELPSLQTPDEQRLHAALTRRPLLSLAEIAQKENVSVRQLPKAMKKHIQSIKEYMKTPSFTAAGREIDPHIDFIFQSWQATRNLSRFHPLYSFAQTLDSFDTFFEAYFTENSTQHYGRLISLIDAFVREKFHPDKKIYVQKGHPERSYPSGLYNISGDWVRTDLDYDHMYVDRSIIEEAIAIGSLPQEPTFFHQSGSAILSSVGSIGEIVSGKKANALGLRLQTGESVTDASEGKIRQLNSVYASNYLQYSGYERVRWFDEGHITFGISRQKLEDYYEQKTGVRPTMMKKEYYIHDEDLQGHFIDAGKNGTLLGPEVPLTTVNAIYTERIYLDRIKEWAKQHAPQAQVISIEAGTLLAMLAYQNEHPDQYPKPITLEWLSKQPAVSIK